MYYLGCMLVELRSLEISSDYRVYMGSSPLARLPPWSLIHLNSYKLDGSVTRIIYCSIGEAHGCEDVQPAPINPICPANEIWSAKVTRKCHVPRYYHGPASQGISMSILAQTPRLR